MYDSILLEGYIAKSAIPYASITSKQYDRTELIRNSIEVIPLLDCRIFRPQDNGDPVIDNPIPAGYES